MNRFRLLLLIAGPLPILFASLAVSRWARPEPSEPLVGNHVVQPTMADRPLPAGVDQRPAETGFDEQSADSPLRENCRKTAEQLRERLGQMCSVIVRPPFVLAGDLTRDALEDWYQRTIGPASRSMANAYFKVPPNEPITVLLFSNEESYNAFAKQLFGDKGISVYGYYKPNRRTLVMNISTGGGTLVHELTHALVDFDFPRVPDWFNEGLASLHEQCRIRPDESGIDGLTNWRLPGLQEAIGKKRLRSLEDLINGDDFRGSQVGINYAQARYFCLYMQHRNVLVDFFRKFRANQEQDPMGSKTVRDVFADSEWAELDEAFQRWVLTLKR